MAPKCSPRNYPESYGQREPKSRKAAYVRDANLRGVVLARMLYLMSVNPRTAGSESRGLSSSLRSRVSQPLFFDLVLSAPLPGHTRRPDLPLVRALAGDPDETSSAPCVTPP